jgi:tRNA(Ile)-lysidine synthase
MLKDFEQKVADFISAEGFFSSGQNVLLACSGGADSTALLHVMAKFVADGVLPLASAKALPGLIREQRRRAVAGVKIYCAHINHQLRGDEAGRDEDFVVGQCCKLGLPLVTRKIDVRRYAKKERMSIESAARKLRIEALIEIARQQSCTCIAIAHQKNDNAETVLQRLSRGTGLRGLCGIWPVKQFSVGIRFVRPLLCVTRPQIIRYLEECGLKWCEDRTNLDYYYRRNFIRNRLLPALQKDCKTDIVEQLGGLANTARGFYRLICRSAGEIWADVAKLEDKTVLLDSGILRKLQPEVKIETVRRALIHLAVGEQDLTQRHYRDVLRLSEGKIIQLPDGIEAHRQGGKIVFAHRRDRDCRARQVQPKKLKIPGQTEFAGIRIEAEIFDYDSAKFKNFKANKNNAVEWLDFERVKPPIVVRFRKSGDRFRPLGLTGEKKVGKFLTGVKASEKLRRKILVIADAEKIIWLCPVRISERAKVAAHTKQILQLNVCA